jgi:hypothetical protein
MPSDSSRYTSPGLPRIVEEIGATVTRCKYGIALDLVKITTGRSLSGGAKR